MQVSVENTGKLGRRLEVQIPAERVDRAISDRLKQISRTARLNGFRPGKAPLTVIRQQFGAQVQREVIGDLLQSSFSEAVAQQQLQPAGSPRIEPQAIGEGARRSRSSGSSGRWPECRRSRSASTPSAGRRR